MHSLKKNPMFLFLAVLTIFSTIGLQAWRTLFDNFAVNVVGLDGHHIGLIQSAREIPGFLTLLAVYLLLIMKEQKLAAMSVLVMGLGIGLTGLLPSFAGLVLTTIIMSFGFHYFEAINQSLTMQHFDQTQSPKVFGRLRSLAAASNIAVGLVIYFAASVFDYKHIYQAAGLLLLMAAMWGLTRRPTGKESVAQKKKVVLRKKYWLYYLLTFLAGARRQIFVAFAVFLMVKKFHFSVQEITVLFILNNFINYFLSPYIGKSIIKYGERKVLSLEYFSLIFIFLAYAVVESRILVACLYILDHVFFNFAMAIRTYFQKIGDPRDIAPTMTVGFTINHIAAVVLPAVGGFLWLIDYRIPFCAGAFLSFVSLVSVQFIRVKN